LALLQESRKSFGMLVSHVAKQFEQLLSFHFRLWQSIAPSTMHAQVRTPEEIDDAPTIFVRLFGYDLQASELAVPVSKESISGFFDVRMDINPEAPFERQMLLNLLQLTAPFIQEFPLGQRELLKRVWDAMGQHGFAQIWPEALAKLQSQTRMLATQLQLATLEQQLEQLQQADAQQQAAAAQAQNPFAGAENGNALTPDTLAELETLVGAIQQAESPSQETTS
jgi:hypothetical protein